MKKLITVFTPTYNRKENIHNCYNSLKAQTSYNFDWLIIDDGSTDGTEELIRKWQKNEDNFLLKYVYKENGGLHTGYNEGIKNTDTELFMCIDSDDWMPCDAIEKIEKIWASISDKGYVGIMGIDRYENGDSVGDLFPEDVHEMYLHEKLTKYCIDGDKKMVHRTELLKKVAPMPTFLGEKNFNPSYMMYQLDKYGKMFVTNDCFCIVDYQPDGMSSNIYKQYRNSPNSFAETRKLYLSFPNQKNSFKLRQYIHYDSSCFFAKKTLKGLKEAPNTFLAIAMLPFGMLLSLFVNYKAKK